MVQKTYLTQRNKKINTIMKKDIHPKYYPNAIIHCSCGKTFKIGAAKPEMHIEICSACHPFYTGQDKIVDTAGRVEKFKKRLAKKKR
jgi:large subunit ribosomal protein L31